MLKTLESGGFSGGVCRFIEDDPIQTGVLQSCSAAGRQLFEGLSSWLGSLRLCGSGPTQPRLGRGQGDEGTGHSATLFDVEVGVVPDFLALKGLLRPLPPTPLVGPGNVPIFEENGADAPGDGYANSSDASLKLGGKNRSDVASKTRIPLLGSYGSARAERNRRQLGISKALRL